MRLLQLSHPDEGRRVAVVNEHTVALLSTHQSVYDAAQAAVQSGRSLTDVVGDDVSEEQLDYDEIYEGRSSWSLLPCLDHPHEPARCMVSGTGLTHKASVENRQAMHEGGDDDVTDSMKIYQWGLEGGKPDAGEIGVQPEWFYKGDGFILRGHNDPLTVFGFADDGGEEPEICGLYIVDDQGTPRRIGLCVGNEFSDHVMEKKNYLYLAPSKLRECAIGPELCIDPDFADVKGSVSVERSGATAWSAEIASGEANMSHTLANLEHHQFKYPAHRRPGDVHVFFFGADAFSFGDGFALQEDDIMEVTWEGLGRPLRNPIRFESKIDSAVEVTTL